MIPKSIVEGVFKEVQKNFQTKVIENESSSNLKQVKQDLTEFNSDFSEAVRFVYKWKKKKESENTETLSRPSRSKRIVEEEKTGQLSLGQRKALFNFYKEFCQIKGKQGKYTDKLQKTQEGLQWDEETESISRSEFIEALEKIGWSTGDRVTFGKYLNIKEGEEDPFSKLLDSEFLKKIRNKVSDLEDFIKKFKDRINNPRTGILAWNPRLTKYAGGSLGVFEGELEKMEDEMSNRIAQKLMSNLPIPEEFKSSI
ncbi:hypothetical protein [Mycoplasma suis]|uniref:hypothetical protein n=1 Tax=Mycoplasma suis TaxID=57372 RepID=UPI001E36F7D2|nr:hypothetical protein [Mycoplasma suis]